MYETWNLQRAYRIFHLYLFLPVQVLITVVGSTWIHEGSLLRGMEPPKASWALLGYPGRGTLYSFILTSLHDVKGRGPRDPTGLFPAALYENPTSPEASKSVPPYSILNTQNRDSRPPIRKHRSFIFTILLFKVCLARGDISSLASSMCQSDKLRANWGRNRHFLNRSWEMLKSKENKRETETLINKSIY